MNIIYKILNKFILSKNYDKLNPFLKRKFFKIFKVFFVKTELYKLPKKNHHLREININQEIDDIKKVKKKKLIPWTAHNNLVQLIKNLNLKKIKFLDIGAGSLSLYVYLNMKIKNLNYYYYDLPNYIELNKKIKKKLNLKNLIIYEKITNLKEKFNLVYFGSSLQYMKNYKIIIKKLLKKSNYFLISLTPFYECGETDKIIVKQVNLSDNILFHYIFNLKDFIKFMKNNNYILVANEQNLKVKFLNFKNFEKKYKNLRMLNLLFKKNEAI